MPTKCKNSKKRGRKKSKKSNPRPQKCTRKRKGMKSIGIQTTRKYKRSKKPKTYEMGVQATSENIVNECEDLLEYNKNTFEIFQEMKGANLKETYPTLVVETSHDNRISDSNIPDTVHDCPKTIRYFNEDF